MLDAVGAQLSSGVYEMQGLGEKASTKARGPLTESGNGEVMLLELHLL